MSIADELKALLGAAKVSVQPALVARLSKDFYWYSQILEAQLKDCVAEIAAFPEGEADVLALVRYAQERGVPLTMRGAGTGNYGQAIPMHGGILVDMTRMADILEIGNGWMRAQAGARMSVMESTARRFDQELCIFPSTYEKSTLGGFVCGGAGGVGSVTHGWLWDGNVLGARLVTAEHPPKARELSSDQVDKVIHGYGLTGVLAEVTVPLAPRQAWSQIVVTFEDFGSTLDFAEALTVNPTIRKRLISVSEATIVPLFNMAMPLLPNEHRHPALLIVAAGDVATTLKLASEYGGSFERELPSGRHPAVTDFCFNHVTLWAKKKDPAWTYLQSGFDVSRIHDQIAQVKARYGDAIIHHFEYLVTQGAISPGGLLLLKYESPEQIDEVIAFLQGIGVWVTNPHTYLLEGGVRKGNQWAGIFRAKPAYDPDNIFNPGKMRVATAEAVA